MRQENLQKTAEPAFSYDPALLFPVLFLVGIGIVMVYSASSAFALQDYGSPAYFVKRQAVFALMGIMGMIFCRRFPFHLVRRLAYAPLFLAMTLLVMVRFSPLGHEAGGAVRWLRLGGVSFQPSELARIALVIWLAYSMASKKERMGEFSIGFLPHMIVTGVLAGLILLQPDFGSAAILCAVTGIMLFVGGGRILHLLGTGLVLVPTALLVMVRAEYRWKRLISFLNPWQYPDGEGYQIVHSLLAFGTGGTWGAGLGKGFQKLFYLPEPHTDFVFSVVGEELGLAGVAVILLLYGVILWRGLHIAAKARSLFASYVAAGISVSIGLQAFINMAVTLGLLPTKGLTLPFLSFGGTSLLLNMCAVGLLMNISATQTGPAEAKWEGTP